MSHSRRRCALAGAILTSLAGAACGGSASVGSAPGAAGEAGGDLVVSPQDGSPPAGFNRVGLALFVRSRTSPDQQTPLLDAAVSYDLERRGGRPIETRPLHYIGGGLYRNIPVYLGVGNFPSGGEYELAVHARTRDGAEHRGHAFVKVVTSSPELPVGHSLTELAGSLRQRTARDVGGDLGQIDSGIADGRPAPDPFHDQTVADGLQLHKPMILYFGQPGHCVSEVCGPTVQVLEQLYAHRRDDFFFEHIEVHDPASGTAFNPLFIAFGLQAEPQIYFVNAQGIVADKYVGPVSLEQLEESAAGTLAGQVPAVRLAPS